MKKSQYAAAALVAAVCIAWIIWPRPVFTAMVLAVVLACLAGTAAAAVSAIRRRGAK
jgi:Sec-independent protein secretion pathway component TatC